VKKFRLILAVLVAVVTITVGITSSAHAAERRSACSQGLDPTCNPGAGWTEVFIMHTSGTTSWAIDGNPGTALSPAYEDWACKRFAGYYWWYRWVNGGAEIQFTLDGSDGNFHGLGFSGGQFKTQSSATVDLYPYDKSGSNWSFADYPGVNYFMDSPDAFTYLKADLITSTPSPSHWSVVAAPFPAVNVCNIMSPGPTKADPLPVRKVVDRL
jgi:hypothetical protein